MTIVSATGHRPDKLPNKETGYIIPNPTYNYIYRETKKILIELNPDGAISGMALGFDTYFAIICIREGIPLTAAVPFEGQEKMWPEKLQKQYRKILDKCESVHIVCDGGYAAWKMMARNKWMSDNSDVVLACFDGSLGGTFNAISYAESIGREIIVIDPRKANESGEIIE